MYIIIIVVIVVIIIIINLSSFWSTCNMNTVSGNYECEPRFLLKWANVGPDIWIICHHLLALIKV